MPQLPFSDLNLDRRHGRAGSSSRVLPPKRVPQAAASGAWVRNAARVVIRGSRSARQPIRQGELRPSLRAGRRSGVLARTSISARLNRGGPDVICRVQSGASDELPLSGHALRRQSVASRKRQRELGPPRSGRRGTVSFPPRPAMSVVGQLAICRSTVNRWRRRDRSNSRRSLGLAQTTAVDPLATIVSLNGNDGPCPHMRPSACTIVASASGRALPIAIPPAKFTLDHW